ncbi:MAG TPA: molybdopterin-guanine dinucleotide biosynthesis protein MobB [Gammaproteobacteria bacterium]|nr:molybdopterin-guanine dinucleotide biosynthesis protein MobB [Gammaproteobacteria bacterium]
MTDWFRHPPVLGFAAWSGTGKTTLLVQLLPALRARGLRIGMIKHAHHAFDVDKPGKDSYELRKAGAEQTLVASRLRLALMVEHPEPAEPDLPELIRRLDRDALDLILVEGFKHERFPKIELHRAALGKPWLFPDDDTIVAVAADTPVETALPRLDLNDTAGIADFIGRRIAATGHPASPGQAADH